MSQQSVIVQLIYRSRGLKVVSSLRRGETKKNKASLAGVCVNVNKSKTSTTPPAVCRQCRVVLHNIKHEAQYVQNNMSCLRHLNVRGYFWKLQTAFFFMLS